MKKVLVVLALCVPFAAMLAVDLPVATMTKTSNPVCLSELQSMPEEQELKYDELVPSQTILLALRKEGHSLAVKCEPTTYPFEITQACYLPVVWLYDPAWDETEHDLVFYTPDLQGKPGDEIGRKTVIAKDPQDLNWFDVSDIGMSPIESGEFFFAIEALYDAPNDSTPCYPCTWLDEQPPVWGRSWTYNSFTDSQGNPFEDWLSFNEFRFGPPWPGDKTVGDSLDVILRVKGNVVGIGEVELGPGGVIKIAPLVTVMPSTGTVNYTLPEAGNIEITLWDAVGRPVKTLYTGHADAGEHTLAWDASGLPSGAYFIRLKTPSTVSTAKLVLID